MLRFGTKASNQNLEISGVTCRWAGPHRKTVGSADGLFAVCWHRQATRFFALYSAFSVHSPPLPAHRIACWSVRIGNINIDFKFDYTINTFLVEQCIAFL